jgi:hypothetical protein
MQYCNDEVSQEIRLAKAQADRQHQLLQWKEQEVAGKRFQDLKFRSKHVTKELKFMQLQREQLESRTSSRTYSLGDF